MQLKQKRAHPTKFFKSFNYFEKKFKDPFPLSFKISTQCLSVLLNEKKIFSDKNETNQSHGQGFFCRIQIQYFLFSF